MQTGNRAYGLAGVERKQKRRLLKRANKGTPSLARRRQAKERDKARRLRLSAAGGPGVNNL